MEEGIFLFSEGAQRDHESRGIADLSRRTSLAEVDFRFADHGSMSALAILRNPKSLLAEARFPVPILLRSRRTVDPNLESELKTDVSLLARENPGAEQDG
jgi:hypothetical protein